jgi:hypothetical protein
MHASLRPHLLLLALPLTACTDLPPAVGLDQSARHMVREFFADDALFEVGVQGFFKWFEDEGSGLIDLELDLENSGAFTVGDLFAEDIAGLPIDDELVVDKTNDGDVTAPRDVTTAAGTVSIALMDCTVQQAEQLLTRKDQDAVFPLDWEGYDRTYASPLATYEGSWDDKFDTMKDPVDPFAEGFDKASIGRTMLFTENDVDPTAVLVANIPSYPMDLIFRHGVYEVADREAEAVTVLTFSRAAAWGNVGANALLQSFSVEINIATEDDRTVRMLAVWAEPKGGGIDPDSALATNFAVDKARKSSECMSRLCSGEITEADKCK